MRVRDIMTPSVRTLPESATAEEAAREMALHNVGALPVCEGELVIGIITDRDLVIRCMAAGRVPALTYLRDVMSRSPLTLEPTDTIGHAARVMGRHGIRRLPVVDQGHAVGILSADDIARFFEDDELVANLEPRLADAAAADVIL
jgi:CBS domain-containing protein